MGLIARLLENTAVYKIHQAPFAERKLAPLFAHNDVSAARRVLDLGCGPGTNAHHFGNARYVGADLNAAYVAAARRRFRRPFVVADATEPFLLGGSFDFILVNSLYHHIDEAGVRRSLSFLRNLLAQDGYIHILDLVLPPKAGLGRALARLDRGDFARPQNVWQGLFTEEFETVVFEPYAFGFPGLPMWQMVYFKGTAR